MHGTIPTKVVRKGEGSKTVTKVTANVKHLSQTELANTMITPSTTIVMEEKYNIIKKKRHTPW